MTETKREGTSPVTNDSLTDDSVSLLRNADRVWWVNQGRSYELESKEGYIFAGKKAKDGRAVSHHINVSLTKPGDVIVHYANGDIKAVSRVTSKSYNSERDGSTGWKVNVDYLKLESPYSLGNIPGTWRREGEEPFDFNGNVKQGYLFKLSIDFARKLADLLEKQCESTKDTVENDTNPVLTLEQVVEQSGLEPSLLAHWLRSLDRKGQAILYGPPGTGKTFTADLIARHLVGGGDGLYETVQFHPAYAYEDFIQGLRPKLNDHGQLDYRLEPGRFLDFIARVKEQSSKDSLNVLVIDEINRADLARVFGELMYLLEYRDKKVPLAGGGTLAIPENVRIIGTMNTADRSVTLIDHALRRRFAFWRLEPDYTFLRDYHQHTPAAPWIADLVTVLEEVNRSIDNPDRSLGTSFFLTKTLDLDTTADIWQTEIEPYLEEIFFDPSDKDKIDSFRWGKVSKILEPKDVDSQ